MLPAWQRFLLIFCGLAALTLGIAGVFLPLLPTTPFLLLAAACFVRSSQRLYRWLLTNRLLGPYILAYREYRAISVRAKAITVVLLWGTIGYTAFGVMESIGWRIALPAIAAGVSAHILSMRTLTPEMRRKIREEIERQRGL